MTTPTDVIAAFMDGERVDTDALKSALADEAGRDYLIDLAAMREAIRDRQPAFLATRPVWSTRLLWAGTTAALVASAIAGTLLIQGRHSDHPPVPDHIVKLERGLDWRGN